MIAPSGSAQWQKQPTEMTDFLQPSKGCICHIRNSHGIRRLGGYDNAGASTLFRDDTSLACNINPPLVTNLTGVFRDCIIIGHPEKLHRMVDDSKRPGLWLR